MTEGGQARARSRVASLAFVLAASALGVWAIYTYGPRPSGEAEPGAAAAAPEVPAETPPQEETKACCQNGGQHAQAFAGQDFLAGLQHITASGRVEGGGAAFLDGLERTYRQRGYTNLRDLIAEAAKARRRRPKAEKFFWRYEAGDSEPAFIGARGTDADPHSEARTPEPASFSTVVTTDGEGGLRWVTYRQDVTRDLLARGGPDRLGTEAPGVDPPGVPRAPGLVRRFNFGGAGGSLVTFYTSGESAEELLRWYQTNMPPAWQYAPVSVAQARTPHEGVMPFTRGRQFCLVWVTQGQQGGPTSVIVSLKG